jgi:asparagine synthase (glutamine-hydrolysing)
MSVQTGVWNFAAREADVTLQEKLGALTARYCHEAKNTHFAGPIAMEYCPLHTTPESPFECQPYVSPQGTTVTWDGRLDNREQLISQLRDSLLQPDTDVAIVTAAFERWGTECFSRLVGDWALSIWSPRNKTLMLARDFVGIRHLYYLLTDSLLLWCTHLEPLVLARIIPLTLRDEYIAGYLAIYPEADLTPFREIFAVPPGSYVRIHQCKATIHAYWRWVTSNQLRYRADTEYEEHFRHVFGQAVRRRLRSDSPILAELSGGLDSSSLVCMADDILAAADGNAPRLDTLSFYDVREPGGDERPYVSKIEERRGRKGFHLDVAKYDSFFTCNHMSAFRAVPGELSSTNTVEKDVQLLISEGGYRVLLSGIGGDEFMGGVPDPRALLADLIVQFRLKLFARELIAWSLAKRRPWLHVLYDTVMLLVPAHLRARAGGRAIVPSWIDPQFAKQQAIALRQLGPQDSFGFWLPSQKSFAQTVSLMSQEFSSFQPAYDGRLEERYPYLDRDLIEFVLSIPPDQLLRPGQRRSLMRRALRGLVPDEILLRTTKATTSRRFMAAFTTEWKFLQDLLTKPEVERRGYVRKGCLHYALMAAAHGDSTQLLRLLKAIALELWLRDLVRHRIVDAGNGPSTNDHSSVSTTQIRSSVLLAS